MRTLLLVVLVSLPLAAPAQAQIYAWRDADGRQVFSDRPRPGDAPVVTFDVGASPAIRATRPAAAGEAGRFDAIIERHAGAAGISADLVRAVIQVESGFDPAAVSAKGAQGLMQLMPATARDLGVVDPFQPEDNIRAGVAYLTQLLRQYGQDVRLALAAYNAGPGSVDRYGDVPPYRETQAYVRKVTAIQSGQSGLGAAIVASVPAPAASKPVRTPPPPPAGRQEVWGGRMYRWLELVDGRWVPRYSNLPPPGGQPFELVRLR